VHAGTSMGNSTVSFSLPQTRAPEVIVVRSSAFNAGAPIPDRYSDYGGKVSPPLGWTGVPQGAKSIALLLEDPDAPGTQPFVHWVLYHLPPDRTELPEAVPTQPRLPELGGALQGKNSAGTIGYFGPRPPPDDPPHHYHFQVYALDRRLDLQGGADRGKVLAAIDGHVLAKGRLIGTYQRPKSK
jgi:Raf kinase inhibitor-like YbhB/YbcL family protein